MTSTVLANATAVHSSASKPARSSSAGMLVQRKCACGASTGSVTDTCEDCHSKTLQRKLAVGSSNDPLEREADRVADQVMSAPATRRVGAAPIGIQRFSGHTGSDLGAAPASVDRVLASEGRPLERVLRHDMEQRFGYDFSRVRVHTGGEAERSARDVYAAAYTVGSHVVFGAGQFAPGTQAGRKLLGHELAHTIQQRGERKTLPCSDRRSMFESNAENAAQGIANRQSVSTRLSPSAVHVARSPISLNLYTDDMVANAMAAVRERLLNEAAYPRRDEDVNRYSALRWEAERRALSKGNARPNLAYGPSLNPAPPTPDTYKPDPRFNPGGFTNDDIYEDAEKGVREAQAEQARAIEQENANERAGISYERLGRFRIRLEDKRYLPEDIVTDMDLMLTPRDRQLMKRHGFEYPTNILTRRNTRQRVIDAIKRYEAAWEKKHSGQPEELHRGKALDAFRRGVDEAAASARAAYDPEVLGSIEGGPIGAVGYGVGGDRGARLGASFDALASAAGGMRQAMASMPHSQSVRLQDSIQSPHTVSISTSTSKMRAEATTRPVEAAQGGSPAAPPLAPEVKPTPIPRPAPPTPSAAGSTTKGPIGFKPPGAKSEPSADSSKSSTVSPSVAAFGRGRTAPAPRDTTKLAPVDTNAIGKVVTSATSDGQGAAGEGRQRTRMADRPKSGSGTDKPRIGKVTTQIDAGTRKTTKKRVEPPPRVVVEKRTASTPDLGEPIASASPRPTTSTQPMKKRAGGAVRGSVSHGGNAPVASPQSTPIVERGPSISELAKPDYSVTPQTPGPDPWAAPPRPEKPVMPRAQRGHHQRTAQAAQDAKAQGLEDLQKGRVGMQQHKTSPAVREEVGIAGQGYDSTHIVPQAVYRAVGAHPGNALAVNLPKRINNAIDAHWTPKWNSAVARGKRITGADVREWVGQGIRKVPDSLLSQAARNSLEWRFNVELGELGITPTTVILPGVP